MKNHHAMLFLFLSCLAIGPLLVQSTLSLNPVFVLAWTGWMLIYLFWFGGLSQRTFFITTFISLLLNFPMALSPLLFPAGDPVYKLVLQNYFRLSAFSLLSLCCAQQFNYSEFLYFMMSRSLLSPTLGHTILLAFNSFARLAKEWSSLRLIGRNRKLRLAKYPTLLFPFMVFTIRNAERGALSLQSRGISNTKTFCFDYAIKPKDWIILSIFSLVYLGIWQCFLFYDISVAKILEYPLF